MEVLAELNGQQLYNEAPFDEMMLILESSIIIHTSHCDSKFLENGAYLASSLSEVHLQLVLSRTGHMQGMQAQFDIILVLSLVRDGHMSPVLTVPVTVATQIATDEQ